MPDWTLFSAADENADQTGDEQRGGVLVSIATRAQGNEPRLIRRICLPLQSDLPCRAPLLKPPRNLGLRNIRMGYDLRIPSSICIHKRCEM
jgi:hypothetical protein